MMQDLAQLPVVLLPASSGGRSSAALFQGLSASAEAPPPGQGSRGEFASQLAGVVDRGSALPPDGQNLPLRQPSLPEPLHSPEPVVPDQTSAAPPPGWGEEGTQPLASASRQPTVRMESAMSAVGADSLNLLQVPEPPALQNQAPMPETLRSTDPGAPGQPSGAPLQTPDTEGPEPLTAAPRPMEPAMPSALMDSYAPLQQPGSASDGAPGPEVAGVIAPGPDVPLSPTPESGNLQMPESSGEAAAVVEPARQPATAAPDLTHLPLPPMPPLEGEAVVSSRVAEEALSRPERVNSEALQRFAEQWSRRSDAWGGQAAERGQTGPMAALNAAVSGQSAAQGPSSSAELMQSWQSQLQASQSPSGQSQQGQSQQGQSQPTPGQLLASGQPGQASLNQVGTQSSSASPQGGQVMDPALSAQRSLMDGNGIAQSGVREQWGDALSRRIQMMTAQQRSEAHIRLDPPELGRLMIQIQMNAEQMSIQFTSPHAMVRDALESSLPRLQEALAEDGLDLLDVDISDQSAEGDSDEPSEGHQAPDEGAGTESGDEPTVSDARLTAAALSLVDAYA